MTNLLIIVILLIITLVTTGWLFSLSYILGFIFLMLMLVSACSIIFARPVIKVTIKADKFNSNVNLTGDLKPVEIELNEDAGYIQEINFADFLESDSILLSLDTSQQSYYDKYGNIKIQVRRSFLQGVRCEILNEINGANLGNYLRFSSSVAEKHNKIIVAFITLFVIITAIAFCDICNKKYHENKQAIQENLTQNISAISLGENITLQAEPETEQQLYYSELPDINLVIITKDKNIFYDPEENFYNPEIVNTVLMLYEDNLSGQRNIDLQDSESENLDAEENMIHKNYYNITELYLNIPILLEDNQIYTMGELFQGTVSYQNQTGYNAVKSWFCDSYHVNIASVTEIPENLFSSCYGTEHAIAVNLNQDFVKFLYDNYYQDSENFYASFSIKEMLAENKPYFSQTMRKNVKELYDQLEKNKTLNRILIMDGDAIVAFGNTVRMTETSEYYFLRNKGYYQDISNFPPLEWDTVHLDSIVHSNWDIVLADVLESISNMNNSMYEIFCKENHVDLFNNIKTSLTQEELHQFLYSLCKANDVLGDEMTQQNQYLFYVRNLKFNVTTTLGEANIYILNRPLSITPYTNRQVKRALYYCLREEKEV